MAEDYDPVLGGGLREMIQRLDERISGLDRNMTDMRADMRQMRTWIFGLYGFILSVAAISIAVVKAL